MSNIGHHIIALLLTCRYKKTLLFCVFFIMGMHALRAQSEPNYAIHAHIIYRFTKYIEWPENRTTGDFVIGVVGESSLYEQLKIFVANKTVGSQKIVVKNYPASAGSFDAHILFVSEGAGWNIKKIAKKIATEPVLLVTELSFPAAATCINFRITDQHLKLEFNKNNIEKRNLNVASELLQLGTIIK
jgi:YfiR/HmsC-like